MNCFRILILVAITVTKGTNSHFEFNNVQCIVRDPTYLTFEYCFLKSINRTYKYISVKSQYYKLPINNMLVTVKLHKRDNKHIFDRFNATIDICKFFKYRSHPLANMLFAVIENYSNVNHTCPFKENFMLEKLPIAHVNAMIKNIIPEGKYVLNSTWIVREIPLADVTMYFTKS